MTTLQMKMNLMQTKLVILQQNQSLVCSEPEHSAAKHKLKLTTPRPSTFDHKTAVRCRFVQ